MTRGKVNWYNIFKMAITRSKEKFLVVILLVSFTSTLEYVYVATEL